MDIVAQTTDMHVFRFIFTVIVVIAFAILMSYLLYKMNRIDKYVKMSKSEKVITTILSSIVWVGCIGAMIFLYVISNGYQDKYIQVKGEGYVKHFDKQEELLEKSKLIATIKTKDNQLIRVMMDDNRDLAKMNNEETLKKGDKVKVTSNQKYQLKHHFNEAKTVYQLTEGSQLKKAK